MVLSFLHFSSFTKRHAICVCWLYDVFFGVFHASGLKGTSSHSLFIHLLELMLIQILCNSRASADYTRKDAPMELPPLTFARDPKPRKLKFLDFSAHKTRVVADIDGGLPQTQVSCSSVVTNGTVFSGKNGDGQCTLTHYDSDSVLETSVVVGVAPPAVSAATKV
jgi:hypothetical protein